MDRTELSPAVLTQSAEDYLEAMLMIGQEGKVVRTSELAGRMAVRMPSVVAALRNLKEKGLVLQTRYGYAELTPGGRSAARRVYERHQALYRFLHDFLGIGADVAQADACRMEHALSPRTMKRLLEFMRFVGRDAASAKPCVVEFHRFLATGQRRRCKAGVS